MKRRPQFLCSAKRGGFILAIAVNLITTPTATPASLTLGQAVESSLKNYPSVRVSQEQMNAAAEGIRLARTAYLPKVDAVAQVNRATRNNVFGMVLPQSVIPSISGPVIGSNNLGSAWGSAAGVLVTWEPFDFGLRSAGVSVATAARAQSEAAVRRTQFDVLGATADAYLTLVAAQETVRAAQAGVDRAEVIGRTITAQVSAELRPGADRSRAEAEVAAARTQLIQAEQSVDVARATLSQFVGTEPSQVAIVAGNLVKLPPEETPAARNTAANPLRLNRMPPSSRPGRNCVSWSDRIFRSSISRLQRMREERARR
jgi:outer membrane protein TolC